MVVVVVVLVEIYVVSRLWYELDTYIRDRSDPSFMKQ